MTLLVLDPHLRDRLIAQRQASGGDRYDEVWDGVYVMSPIAGDEHQRIVARLAAILELIIGMPGLGEVRAGTNLSDRADGWTENYRVPDVAVKLLGGKVQILESHWCGGPDFLVEILSEGDQAREKLAFYAALGTREVLVVDRDPWSLELYALEHERLVPIGVARPESPGPIASRVLPLTFALDVEPGPKPRIAVVHTESGERWVF